MVDRKKVPVGGVATACFGTMRGRIQGRGIALSSEI